MRERKEGWRNERGGRKDGEMGDGGIERWREGKEGGLRRWKFKEGNVEAESWNGGRIMGVWMIGPLWSCLYLS